MNLRVVCNCQTFLIHTAAKWPSKVAINFFSLSVLFLWFFVVFFFLARRVNHVLRLWGCDGVEMRDDPTASRSLVTLTAVDPQAFGELATFPWRAEPIHFFGYQKKQPWLASRAFQQYVFYMPYFLHKSLDLKHCCNLFVVSHTSDYIFFCCC